jgi:broad specificity phosphatase PhoE
MKNIWFIRHGQSESNAGLKTTHPKITALTEHGKIQSKHIADYIQIKPDLIIHSPYLRAIQTAQPVIEKFPDVPVEEWPVQEFTYLCPQKYCNTTRYERREFTSRYWQSCDPQNKDSEDSESFNEFIQRVIDCHQKLNGRNEHILIFTHGHIMRAIIWMQLLGSSGKEFFNMQKYANLRQALSISNGAILKTRIKDKNAAMSSLITSFLPDSLITG